MVNQRHMLTALLTSIFASKGVNSFIIQSSRSVRYHASKTTLSVSSMTDFQVTTAKPGNEFWKWRGQDIRFVVHGALNKEGPCVILVHGLFVNADHFRKNGPALADAGFRVFSIDLLGSGYSSKPDPYSEEAKQISGENGRSYVPNGLIDINLGTSRGGSRKSNVALAHPLGSCYNFYTWAEQLEEFAEQVVKPLDGKVVLVANSIGSMSALQAAVDKPHVFDGVFIINPNFRELHVAETPALFHPVLRVIQAGLRTFGNPLFNALAKPETVKQILREPYKVADAVTDELVEVLLTPLLEPGSAEVVFDLLSYSSGPLPEQLLQEVQAKVEVVFGDKDPWTPPARVLALERFGAQRVTPIPDVGHCPHDEAPEIVNPMMVDFVNRVVSTRQHKS